MDLLQIRGTCLPLRLFNAPDNAHHTLFVGPACRNRLVLYICLKHFETHMRHAKDETTEALWEYYKELEEMTSKVVVNARAAWFDSAKEGMRPLLARGALIEGADSDGGTDSDGGGGDNDHSSIDDGGADSDGGGGDNDNSSNDDEATERRASYEEESD